MFVKINGTRLFVDISGSSLIPNGDTMKNKPSIILLHGGPGMDHTAFKETMKPLEEVAQLIYYDHRGMGRSYGKNFNSLWNLKVWGQDLGELIEMLGINNPIILGQSFGGYVAQELASTRPDLIGGLILSSTSCRDEPVRVDEAFRKLGADEEVVKAIHDFYDTPNDQTWKKYEELCFPYYNQTPQNPLISKRGSINKEVLFDFWAKEMKTLDYRERLSLVSCPSLVICGDKDPITPPIDSKEIYDSLTGCVNKTLSIISGAGHGAYRDNPDDFFKEVRSLIDRI